MKFGRVITVIGVLLLTFGISLSLFAAHLRSVNANIQSSPTATAKAAAPLEPLAPTVRQGKPVTISIDALSIHNSVIDGVFNSKSQQWTLTRDKVQFATMTREPNDERGLTFMYGHNRKEVFSKLRHVQAGGLAIVTTDNGYKFTYRFVESKTVGPTDISIFSYDGTPILVLQTCTGLFFENRQLFTFELIGVTNV